MGYHLQQNRSYSPQGISNPARGPKASYAQALLKEHLQADPYQAHIISRFQQLYFDLTRHMQDRSAISLQVLRHWLSVNDTAAAIKGLYLWGGVGRGKTHLMDLFFESVESEKKMRLHFHRFMALVHEQLEALPGNLDPLREVAQGFAHRAQLLCLDEFQVEDIGDAMILARLFEALFESGVVIVMTSNTAPDDLYEGGLQRERFVPAIELIKAHTEVMEIGGTYDYRRSFLSGMTTWFVPPGEIAERLLLNSYHEIAAVERHRDRSDIIVNQRRIPVKRWADGVVWFDFGALCETPRTASDYAEIGRFFHTVLISGIPVLTQEDDDAAHRLIVLVDELYERKVKLLATAEALPEKLYGGHRLIRSFKRTISRLKEMQSDDYFARKHLSRSVHRS